MPTTVNFNSTNYSVPNNREPKGWGAALTTYLIALGENALAKSGGTFTLTGEVDFGATYGLVVAYLKSKSSNISTTGIVRFANNEGAGWRDQANSADKILKVNTSDNLEYDGNKVFDQSDLLDEDNMASDSATQPASQQSIKAYVDNTAVLKAGAQTITGVKTFDTELNLKEISTPSNPSSGYKKIYPKTDGKLYTLDSSGNEIQVGSGVGGGSLNLNINPDAEIAVDNSGTNDVGDYIDSGAGTTASKSTTSSEIPLYSFKETAVKITLASGTNDYTRLRFRVPASYRSKVLGIGWEQITSGLASQNIKVELYRYSDAYVTGEEEVALQGTDDSSGNTYIKPSTGPFRTSFVPNSYEYYELRWINNGATSGYLSMNSVSFDDGDIGFASSGVWKTYTESDISITGTSSWSTVRARIVAYKDLGGNWRIKGNVQGTSSSVTAITITFPGLTFPSSNQAGSLSTNTVATADECYAIASTATAKIEQGAARTSWWFSFDWEVTSKPTWVDYDGSVLTASEARLQNARGRFFRNAAGGYSSGNNFAFDTEETTVYDPAIGVSNSSGLFTVDYYGTYDITVVLSANPAWAANTQVTLHVNRGSGLTQEDIIVRPGSSSFTLSGNTSVKLNAGNSFSFRANDTVTMNQGRYLCYVIIERRSNIAPSLIGFPTSEIANETEQVLLAKVIKTTTAIVANTGNYISGNLHIRRMDNIVTITSESTLTHSSQTTATSATGLLPTWARPTNTMKFFITDGREFFVNADGSISTTATVAVTDTALPVHACFLVYDDQ